MQENQQKTAEDFGTQEDKVGHLLKVKAKLEQTLDELEDSLEREKKTRAETDKAKRKVEGDLKLTQEAVADLEKNKRELEQTIQRKDREIGQLSCEYPPYALRKLVVKLHGHVGAAEGSPIVTVVRKKRLSKCWAGDYQRNTGVLVYV